MTDVKASVAAGQFVDGEPIPVARNVVPAGQATLASSAFLPPS